MLSKGDLTSDEPLLVRLHSECLTGDVFGSLRCDCGEQLHAAMKKIDKLGCGAILYLRQEGRGIGLKNKLKAYQLQEKGFDTYDANLELGFAPDERDYQIAADILSFLNIKQIKLLTNNPDKLEQLENLVSRLSNAYRYKFQRTLKIVLTCKPNKKNFIIYYTSFKEKKS